MKLITSKNNDLLKHIRALSGKKIRREFSEFVAEGTRWIYDALNIGNVECVVILLKNSRKDDFLPHLQKFLNKVTLVDDIVFDKIEETENGQGIIAVFKQNLKTGIPKGDKILILDRISDPGNLGTIIRTACGAGYIDIILLNCCDPYTSKSARASMSALLKVNIFESEIDILKELVKTHTIIGADINGKNIYKMTVRTEKDTKNIATAYCQPQKKCLVIGSEAHGISNEIKSLCHDLVSIPMQNIESLNAAVSAGILMYSLM